MPWRTAGPAADWADAEAMSVKVPVVNVGSRQRGREHLSCMINVEHDRRAIEQGVVQALEDPEYLGRLEAFSSPLVRDTEALVAEFLAGIDLSVSQQAKPFLDWPDSTAPPIASREERPTTG